MVNLRVTGGLLSFAFVVGYFFFVSEGQLSFDDFEYALENTRVILPPQGRLETFGNTLLTYHLITEEMDHINQSRVREGRIQAEKPALISPEHFSKLLLEGFGERAEKFAQLVSKMGGNLAMLKYGFSVRKSEIKSYLIHESVETVTGRVKEEVLARQDPLTVVLTGVDDGWEVCLLKFMLDMISASGAGNIEDFRRRGLL